MYSFIDPTESSNRVNLRVAGILSNPFVHSVYPIEMSTRIHKLQHLPGLTGKWMDTGGTALRGVTKGSFHRLDHGHHLMADGVKVLLHPKLKFGDFLHHLGCDFLTRRGIPNPLIPKKACELLMRSGMSKTVANELVTVNLRKVLGGGLVLAFAGRDVWLAFSDAIPHTFAAAGTHAAIGALSLATGCYPPNPLLLLAGTGELGVAALTAWRSWCDPALPVIGLPRSVYLPLLGHALWTSGLIGGALGTVFSGDLGDGFKSGAAAACGAGASLTVGAIAKAAGWAAGPLPSLIAGQVAYTAVQKVLTALTGPSRDPGVLPPQVLAALARTGKRRAESRVIPALALLDRPIFRLE